MKGCFGVFLVVILLAKTWEIQGNNEENVITLHQSNFSKIVSKHDFIVVEFYAPWCDHSKRLAPEYENAASELTKNDPPITLSKIDATLAENRELVTRYNVDSTPTLIIITHRGESIHRYKGPLKAAGIAKYLKKQLGPASTEIRSKTDVHNVIDQKNIFILGVFPRLSGEKYESFIKVAEKLRFEYDFGHMRDSTGPFIRLLKPFDEFVADSQNFDIDALENFIKEEDSPSYVEFDLDRTNDHLEKMFFSNTTKVIMVLNYKAENADALKSKFYDTAYLLRGGNLSFIIGDVEPSKPLLQYFQLSESQAPLMFVQTNDDKKYLKSDVDADEVVFWFRKVLDGKVKEFKLSQAIPKVNNEPVKVVVYDNLDDMVLNSGKQVLLEFYAPLCAHCQNIAPILDEVAKSYAKDPNVLIAKFDATLNDVPSETFNVKGVPTIYLTNGNKEIFEYDGDISHISKEHLIKFIEEHRSDKKTTTDSEIKSKPDVERGDETISSKDEL
ncbi:hypothetical protein vseg_009802 [Gypsophila vaccaria]